ATGTAATDTTATDTTAARTSAATKPGRHGHRRTFADRRLARLGRWTSRPFGDRREPGPVAAAAQLLALVLTRGADEVAAFVAAKRSRRLLATAPVHVNLGVGVGDVSLAG